MREKEFIVNENLISPSLAKARLNISHREVFDEIEVDGFYSHFIRGLKCIVLAQRTLDIEEVINVIRRLDYTKGRSINKFTYLDVLKELEN